MATHDLDITDLAFPASSGNATWQSVEALETNKRYPRMVLVFNDTSSRDDVSLAFEIPKNYVSNPKFVALVRTSATSGNLIVIAAYTVVNVDATESADPSADDEGSISATVAAPGTANRPTEAVMTPATASNFAAGKLCLAKIGRNGAGSDTVAAKMIVERIYFRYDDA
jgi:hypothetical protein